MTLKLTSEHFKNMTPDEIFDLEATCLDGAILLNKFKDAIVLDDAIEFLFNNHKIDAAILITHNKSKIIGTSVDFDVDKFDGDLKAYQHYNFI